MENFLKFWKNLKFLNFFFIFFMIFNELYFCEFLTYTSNQVVEKYLLAQYHSLSCTMWARAQLRARCAAVKMGEKMRFFAIFIIAMCGGAFFFARNRACVQMVRANRFSWSWSWFLTTWSSSYGVTNFFQIQMTVWTIQNDYLDHVRHFETYSQLFDRLKFLFFRIRFSKLSPENE